MLRLLRLPLKEIRLHTEAAGSAPPEAFGPFRKLHQIGAGALGPVFRAYEPDRDRLVAVKLFRLDLPPERVHQLVGEFERLIAVDLQHPAIAAPRATGIDGVSAYLAQDFAAADSLDIVIRENGPAPLAEALRVAGQLASALDYAADRDVLHGSLHPRDILLSQDDIRIVGIGVTPALERAGLPAPMRMPYTAPERIGGGAWDRRADVFSLAATVYELLCGRRVAGTGDEATVSLTDIAGCDPQALRKVFARALADEPADRFATATEFVEALQSTVSSTVNAESVPALEIAEPVEAAALVENAPPKPKRLARGGLRVVAGAPIIAPRLPLLEDVVDVPEAPAITLIEEPAPVEPAGIAFEPVAFEPPMAESRPVFAPQPHQPASSSSASVWPIAVAAVIGIALGFGAGYTVAIRDRAGAGVAVATAAPVAAAPAEGPPASKEFTAAPVAAAPVAATPVPEKPAAPVASKAVEPVAAFAGRVSVRSLPSGARVVVDGRDRGQTPATIRELPRGEHRIRIVRDGYTTAERRVVLSPSQPAQSLSVPLAREPRARAKELASPKPTARAGAAPIERADAAAKPASPKPSAVASAEAGTLLVESRPQGAAVTIDGRPAGTTPVSIEAVRAGSHAVRIERDGYRIWTAPVKVAAGEQNRVTASLEK